MSMLSVAGAFAALLGASHGSGALGPIVQETPGMAPLPVSPPIDGVVWTVVIPAFLFLGSFLGTYLLYRRFAEKEEDI